MQRQRKPFCGVYPPLVWWHEMTTMYLSNTIYVHVTRYTNKTRWIDKRIQDLQTLLHTEPANNRYCKRESSLRAYEIFKPNRCAIWLENYISPQTWFYFTIVAYNSLILVRKYVTTIALLRQIRYHYPFLPTPSTYCYPLSHRCDPEELAFTVYWGAGNSPDHSIQSIPFIALLCRRRIHHHR